MKSRISIDLDESNNPIIKIEYAASEDVRDKMVKRFLEGVNSQDGSFLSLYYQVQPNNSSAQVAIIRPCEKNEAVEWVNNNRRVVNDGGLNLMGSQGTVTIDITKMGSTNL